MANMNSPVGDMYTANNAVEIFDYGYLTEFGNAKGLLVPVSMKSGQSILSRNRNTFSYRKHNKCGSQVVDEATKR